MSQLRRPQRRDSRHPARWLAVSAAAAVTALAVAGAAGVVPGVVPFAETASAQEQLAQTVTELEPSVVEAAENHDADQTDDWLSIDEPADQPTDEPADEPAAEPAAPSELPPSELPPGSGSGKRIVYDISDQHTWLVGADDDKVLRHYPVSGGLDVDLLDPGRYRVYSESRHAVSFDLRETMNFMVRFAHGDNSAIGFHDIPEHPDGQLAQSRQELGTPLSAGCIRQWKPDARALFRFADIDTLVVVTA